MRTVATTSIWIRSPFCVNRVFHGLGKVGHSEKKEKYQTKTHSPYNGKLVVKNGFLKDMFYNDIESCAPNTMFTC